MKKPKRNRLAFIASLRLEDFTVNQVNAIGSKYETELHKSIKANGKRHTLDRYKGCYVFLRNYVLELNTVPVPGCKVDSKGIPKILGPLRSFIKGSRNHKRLALTIARSYEQITLPIDYHPESIESPPKFGEEYPKITQEFNQWLEKFVYRYPWYLGSLHLQNKFNASVFTTLAKGPNGPAVSNAHLDAKAVSECNTLFYGLQRLNHELDQSGITEGMLNMAHTVPGENKGITGRLGFSAEPAGKTRVFAIADYGTQTSLKAIQISLYRTLRSINMDCTANQDKGFQTLLKESLGSPTYCFDLESASDRIPAEMQKFRLELLGGQVLAEAGHKVMTERPFNVSATGENLRGKVGQPLGLLSSFPSFSLGHHDVIQFAYSRCRSREGKNPIKIFKKYRLLGDDVVIGDKKVADEYQYLMCKVFGISINLNKSVIGDSRNSQIEFTKRLALRGKEMSSIKHNILTKDNIVNMLDLVDILYERDFITPDTGHHDLYPFLSPKEQTKFSFMLGVRSGCDTPFELGLTSPRSISRNDFNIKLIELRAQSLREKTVLLDEYFTKAKALNWYYEQKSIPYDERALGLINLSERGRLHPLVWAINQTGLELSDALSTIWDEQSPDVAPVEYLPIVSLDSYFHTPRKQSIEHLSKLILSVYEILSYET